MEQFRCKFPWLQFIRVCSSFCLGDLGCYLLPERIALKHVVLVASSAALESCCLDARFVLLWLPRLRVTFTEHEIKATRL